MRGESDELSSFKFPNDMSELETQNEDDVKRELRFIWSPTVIIRYAKGFVRLRDQEHDPQKREKLNHIIFNIIVSHLHENNGLKFKNRGSFKCEIASDALVFGIDKYGMEYFYYEDVDISGENGYCFASNRYRTGRHFSEINYFDDDLKREEVTQAYEESDYPRDVEGFREWLKSII